MAKRQNMPQLLLVEDDAPLRALLRELLEHEGYGIVTAEDGLVAQTALRTGPVPQAILMDWKMPRCDGRAFRQWQLTQPRFRALPTLLFTADPVRVRHAPEAYGAIIVTKPVALESLLAAIAAALP